MAINFYSNDFKLIISLSESDLYSYVKYNNFNVIRHERSTRFNLIWRQFKKIIDRFKLNDNRVAYIKIFKRNNNLVYLTAMFEGERIRITSNDLLQKISPDLKENDNLDPIEIVFSREPIPDTRTDKIYIDSNKNIASNKKLDNMGTRNNINIIFFTIVPIIIILIMSILFINLNINK